MNKTSHLLLQVTLLYSYTPLIYGVIRRVIKQAKWRISFAPVRNHGEQLFRLLWIVSQHVHAELVRAIHAGVHHEFHRKRSLLTRVQCRRTDDRLRRSTPLDELDARRALDRQRLIAHILELELSLDGYVERQLAKINAVAVHAQLGDFGVGSFLRLMRVLPIL